MNPGIKRLLLVLPSSPSTNNHLSRGLPARGRGSQHTPTLAHTTVTNLYGLTLALTVCVFIRQIMNRMCCTEKCVSSLRRGNAGSRQDPETGQQNGSHGEQTAEKN